MKWAWVALISMCLWSAAVYFGLATRSRPLPAAEVITYEVVPLNVLPRYADALQAAADAKAELKLVSHQLAVYESVRRCQPVEALMQTPYGYVAVGQTELCGAGVGFVPGVWGPSLTDYIKGLEAELASR